MIENSWRRTIYDEAINLNLLMTKAEEAASKNSLSVKKLDKFIHVTDERVNRVIGNFWSKHM